MQASRLDSSEKPQEIELYIDYDIFPNLKKLKLEDSGNLNLIGTISRERKNDNDEVEKWMKVKSVMLNQPGRQVK